MLPFLEREEPDETGATATLRAAPHSAWMPVRTGDWIVELTGGWEVVRGADFDKRYEEIS